VDYPLGHAKNPLKDSEVEEKFSALVLPVLGKRRAKKILDFVWKLDEAENVDELMRALKMPTKKSIAITSLRQDYGVAGEQRSMHATD
jgi:hypothetical protein